MNRPDRQEYRTLERCHRHRPLTTVEATQLASADEVFAFGQRGDGLSGLDRRKALEQVIGTAERGVLLNLTPEVFASLKENRSILRTATGMIAWVLR
jgi:hypothetical protein